MMGDDSVPSTMEQVYNRAAAAFVARDYPGVERLCRAILEAQPDHFHAIVLLGQVLEERGSVDLALECYEKAARLNPGDALPFSRTVPMEEQAAIRQFFGRGECVLHIGEFCSDWTNCFRSVHPTLRVIEAGPAPKVDELRGKETPRQIHTLVIEAGCDVAAVLEGAAESLGLARLMWCSSG